MDPTQKPNINPLIKYFVPPKTTQFMLWGQTFLVLIVLLVMFFAIGFAYVYSNMNEYSRRIAVISNAALFGKDPQEMFEKYIQDSQSESIAAAVNNIQLTTDNLNTTTTRLTDQASRLTQKVAVDVPENNIQSNNLGISIQKNIAQLRDTLSKTFGSFVLNNYISNGAIKTVKSKNSAPSASPSSVAPKTNKSTGPANSSN